MELLVILCAGLAALAAALDAPVNIWLSPSSKIAIDCEPISDISCRQECQSKCGSPVYSGNMIKPSCLDIIGQSCLIPIISEHGQSADNDTCKVTSGSNKGYKFRMSSYETMYAAQPVQLKNVEQGDIESGNLTITLPTPCNSNDVGTWMAGGFEISNNTLACDGALATDGGVAVPATVDSKGRIVLDFKSIDAAILHGLGAQEARDFAVFSSDTRCVTDSVESACFHARRAYRVPTGHYGSGSVSQVARSGMVLKFLCLLAIGSTTLLH